MSEMIVPKQCENISCQATRAERDFLRLELGRLNAKGVCDCPRCGAYVSVLAERDALRVEVDRLKATAIKTSDEGTSFCASCEGYARERDALKAENEKLRIVDKYRTSPTPWLVAELPKLTAERDAVIQTLGRERDAWRKLETEIVKERNDAKKELGKSHTQIEDTVIRYSSALNVVEKDRDRWRGIAEKMGNILILCKNYCRTHCSHMKEALSLYDEAVKP